MEKVEFHLNSLTGLSSAGYFIRSSLWYVCLFSATPWVLPRNITFCILVLEIPNLLEQV